MGEPIHNSTNKRRRKFPSFNILSSSSSLYRHVGFKFNCNNERSFDREYQKFTWKEKFVNWRKNRSVTQSSLKFSQKIFGSHAKRKTPYLEPEELNYSTDDDGGFKIWKPNTNSALSNGKQNGTITTNENANCDNVGYTRHNTNANSSSIFNGKERPKSIASFPVRSEDIIVYYDDCFTKSDSSLLSNNYLFRTYSGENTKKKKSFLSEYHHHSTCRYSGPLASSGLDINQQCLSVDSLPIACCYLSDFCFTDHATTVVASSKKGLSSQTKNDKLYLSASYPGHSYYSRGTNVKVSSNSCFDSRSLSVHCPSVVAYQPRIVSTPVVSNCRQVSTNPSRRPNNFPTALVQKNLQNAVSITSAVPSPKTFNPLAESYALWLSYDILNKRKEYGSTINNETRNYRNRLSLPLFTKNIKSRKYAPRSSSLSSVHNLLTPSSLPTKAASLALQQLLNCYRNGDMTQEKISLLLDILDTQERFAKVK
ncbi:hypothetical protein PGB90_002698 [Kerria lacca]